MGEPCVKISVVVPVRNESASIGLLLDRLLEQTLAPAEIVITDGGSSDSTVDIIQDRINKGAPVKLVRTEMALPGRGRNLAAQQAASEWIAFTDAGVVPSIDWLDEMARVATANDRVDVVYGSYEPIIDNLFTECAAVAYVPPKVRIEGSLLRPHSIVSALMRKSVWEKGGGFPEHLRSAEDLLFMRSVEGSGAHIAYAPNAIVRWSVQPSWTSTFKRFMVYSRNNILAGLWREWQQAIVIRYGFLLLLALPGVFVGWWWLAVPFGTWAGMLLLRSIVAIRRNRDSYPASVPRNLARLCLLIPLIGLLDFAALTGVAVWLWNDKLFPGKPQVNTNGA